MQINKLRGKYKLNKIIDKLISIHFMISTFMVMFVDTKHITLIFAQLFVILGIYFTFNRAKETTKGDKLVALLLTLSGIILVVFAVDGYISYGLLDLVRDATRKYPQIILLPFTFAGLGMIVYFVTELTELEEEYNLKIKAECVNIKTNIKSGVTYYTPVYKLDLTDQGIGKVIVDGVAVTNKVHKGKTYNIAVNPEDTSTIFDRVTRNGLIINITSATAFEIFILSLNFIIMQ